MTTTESSPDPFEKRSGRRSVQMRAYLVREDQQVIDVSVGDLSYSGCAVHTDIPLTPGEQVLISVLGRGGGKAVVRWYKDRMAGLEFEQEEMPREHVPRSADRTSVAAEALLRRSGQPGYRVRVFDVSPAGCRCEFIERPTIGERLWIKFDHLEALQSEVCWIEDTDAGLKFMRAVHPAVFDMILQRLT